LKILNPLNTTHTIILQPRFDPTTTLVLELTNEVSKVKTVITNTYTFVAGVVNITFDLVVNESDRFSIEILENSKTIYRGNAFCTAQNIQDYKLTKDKYTFYNG
jgi:hypothetical protein